MSGTAAEGSQFAGQPPAGTGVQPEPPLDLSERLAARWTDFAERHAVLARRLLAARTILLWLSIVLVIVAWAAVPNGGAAIAVLIGLFWLLLQGWILGRSKSLSWGGYARTFRWGLILGPAIAGIEIAIGDLFGWHAGDQAPTVALAGPVEETLKLLPVLVVFVCARNRWRRLGAADLALLGLASGAGFQFAEDTIRRLVATPQPQLGLIGLIASLHGTNAVSTDYGFFQLFPGGNELGRVLLDGSLAGGTVFPGHGVLTAMVAAGVGLAIRTRRRLGPKIWILPVVLWLAAIANHMAANYSTYAGPTPGQPYVSLPGFISTLVHVWYAVGGAYLTLLVLILAAVTLDYRAIAQLEPRLPELPGESPAQPIRRLAVRRAQAVRGSLPPDAAVSFKRLVGGTAGAIEWPGRAIERATHELALLVACAGTETRLWFAAMRWTRERRELAYGLWHAAGGPRRQRPAEGDLRRRQAMLTAALKQAAAPAVAAALGIAVLALVAGTVDGSVPAHAFIAGLLSDFGKWWSHLSTIDQILAVLGLGGLLGLMGMDLLPALGLAAGASTFADYSPLLGAFIRDPRRTTQAVLRNLTPGQVLGLVGGFVLQRLIPAAGGRLLGGRLREGLSAVLSREREAGAAGVAEGALPALSPEEQAAARTWRDGLPARPSPSGTPAYDYEIAHTGDKNLLMRGGGEEIWADGFNPTDGYVLEAKYVGKPDSSPFIEGSQIPPRLRSKIVGEVVGEIQRYKAIIADPANPTRALTIITNDPRAVPLFSQLLREQNVVGRVIVEP